MWGLGSQEVNNNDNERKNTKKKKKRGRRGDEYRGIRSGILRGIEKSKATYIIGLTRVNDFRRITTAVFRSVTMILPGCCCYHLRNDLGVHVDSETRQSVTLRLHPSKISRSILTRISTNVNHTG